MSRQGVQRDLLPVVEGTTVNTRYGPVRTDHILFIAAGAFHLSKPSDLMPELQGRFPIRVELTDLKREDFLRILTEPKHALTKQYAELLATEGVTLEFTPDGIEALADIAFEVNRTTQNIGARRLHTILERVVEEISFEGPDLPEKQRVDRRRLRARPAGGDPGEGGLEQVYLVRPPICIALPCVATPPPVWATHGNEKQRKATNPAGLLAIVPPSPLGRMPLFPAE